MQLSFKRGFTLVELMVAMSLIGSFSSSVFPSFAQLRDSGEDIVRITDIQQMALAMEISRNIFTDAYTPLSFTTPQAIGTELPEVPRNNTVNNGLYGWIDNTQDPKEYCAWARLAVASEKGQYYVATPRGAGFMDEEPVDFASCAFYENDSYDTGTEDNDKKEFVCHVNKKGKQKTLNISVNAVQAHLNHGDTLGQCP